MSVADPLEAEEPGVALVGVEHRGVDAERLEGPHPADAEEDLLAEPVLGVAAVEPVGDERRSVGFSVDVGVEQVQRACGRPRRCHTWARRCSPARSSSTRTSSHSAIDMAYGIEVGEALLLPAVDRQRLTEVAVPVEEADADERDAEVGRRLEVVAGEDAEAAGVLRDAPRRCRTRGRSRRRPAVEAIRPAVVPGRSLEVSPEVVVGGLDHGDEDRVGGQLLEPFGGDAGQQPARVVAASRPTSSASIEANTSRVGRCHDQRRFAARRSSAASGSGRTGRTVKLRTAFISGKARPDLRDAEPMAYP